MMLLSFPALLILLAVTSTSSLDEPEKRPPETVARHVLYSGQVQGVGFRATVAEIAKNYSVTGWVKNLDDGRVELLVEGSEQEVKRFLDSIRKRWQKHIQKEEFEERKPTGAYKAFTISP